MFKDDIPEEMNTEEGNKVTELDSETVANTQRTGFGIKLARENFDS